VPDDDRDMPAIVAPFFLQPNLMFAVR